MCQYPEHIKTLNNQGGETGEWAKYRTCLTHNVKMGQRPRFTHTQEVPSGHAEVDSSRPEAAGTGRPHTPTGRGCTRWGWRGQEGSNEIAYPFPLGSATPPLGMCPEDTPPAMGRHMDRHPRYRALQAWNNLELQSSSPDGGVPRRLGSGG